MRALRGRRPTAPTPAQRHRLLGSPPVPTDGLTTFRRARVLVPKKPWACTVCRKLRPAGTPREDWRGVKDGAVSSHSSCVGAAEDLVCPFVYASWPLWRVHLAADPAWPASHADREKAFFVAVRRPTEEAAREFVFVQECSAAGYVITAVEKAEDGTPDDAPEAQEE